MKLSIKSFTVLTLFFLILAGVQAEEELVAEISYPQSGHNLSGTIYVNGSAGGNQFTSYSLRLKQDSSYHFLGDSSESVEQDKLYQLNTSEFATGNYLLVLDVRGAEGRGITDEFYIYIDNSPPQIPSFTVEEKMVEQGQQPLNFNFSVSEEGSGIKEINIEGKEDSYSLNSESRAFNAPFQLADNSQLTLAVSDYAGNSANRSLIVDAASPNNLTISTNYIMDSNNRLKVGYVEFNTKKVNLRRDKEILAQGKAINSTLMEKRVEQYLGVNTSYLKRGSNNLILEVKDGLDRSQRKEFEAIYDPCSPQFELDNLLPQSTLSVERELSISASDNISGVEEVKLNIDGELQRSFSTGGKHRYLLEAEEIGEGKHQLTVEVRDKAGNLATETMEFTVDLSAPEITDVKAIPNPTNSVTSLIVRANDRFSPLVRAEYGLIRNGNYQTVGRQEVEDREFRIKFEQLTSGENKLWVKTMDAEGHWSEVKEKVVVLDQSLTSNLRLIKQLPRTLQQGEEGKLELIYSNQGELGLANLKLETNDCLVEDIIPAQTDLRKQKTVSFALSIDLPDNFSLGDQIIPITAKSLSHSSRHNLSFKVLPGNKTKRQIENRSEFLYHQLDKLRQKTNELTGVNASRIQKIEEKIRSVEDKLEKASSNISVNNYLTASQLTEEISKKIASIEQEIKELEELKEKVRERKKIITLSLVALGIIGAVIFYIAYPVDEGYTLGRGYIKKRKKSLSQSLLQFTSEKVKKARKLIKKLLAKVSGEKKEASYR